MKTTFTSGASTFDSPPANSMKRSRSPPYARTVCGDRFRSVRRWRRNSSLGPMGGAQLQRAVDDLARHELQVARLHREELPLPVRAAFDVGQERVTGLLLARVVDLLEDRQRVGGPVAR